MQKRSLIKIKQQQGFNMLDVVIAMVVLAVGVLGFAQYQASLMRANTDARLRTMASNIAQETIETQRRFVRLYSDPDGLEFAFDDITDRSENHSMGGVGFSISQTVTPYYWSQESQQFVTTPVASKPHSDFKLLEVTVAWDDPLSFNLLGSQPTESTLGSGAISISSIISSSVTATGRLALIDDLSGDLTYLPTTLLSPVLEDGIPPLDLPIDPLPVLPLDPPPTLPLPALPGRLLP